MKKRPISIIYTGGGSGGHIAPILAVHKKIKKSYPSAKFSWVGSASFEKEAADDLEIEFKEIHSGKLRRYLSFKNITDVARIKIGMLQSIVFLIKNRPTLVFATGGYVSVPVVVASAILRIPVIIHEQTIALGLANKINSFFASKILLAFPDSKKLLPRKRQHLSVETGNPVRESLFGGNLESLQEFLGKSYRSEKKTLYITGGSQGSKSINTQAFSILNDLPSWNIIHQCGRGGIQKALDIKKSKSLQNYFPFAFIRDQLRDIYSETSIVIARSGAGTVSELSHFSIPSIFIPLRPCNADEQTKNAQWFIANNPGTIIQEKDLTKENLLEAIEKLSLQEKSSRTIKGGGSNNKTADEILKSLQSL